MSGTDSIIILLELRHWGVLKEDWTSLWMRMIVEIGRGVHTGTAMNKSNSLLHLQSFSYVLMFLSIQFLLWTYNERQCSPSGPMDNCSFVAVTIGSLHRNKVPCRVVCAGQSASLSLEGPQLHLRKGMKLMSVEARPRACFYFQASLWFSFCALCLYLLFPGL